ncbi:hypothetical protein [Dasania marina]|uniref:hypothetical protein n=1 Tax=Dasania marina TaxID=471499 RepID=UPI0030D6E96E|tara:strand:- start:1575 stop:1832 length:258 start_codon:yes stop_codon:yes gene_type:complete
MIKCKTKNRQRGFGNVEIFAGIFVVIGLSVIFYMVTQDKIKMMGRDDVVEPMTDSEMAEYTKSQSDAKIMGGELDLSAKKAPENK